MITRIWVNYSGNKYPLLQIDEPLNRNDVLIYFTWRKNGSHITIHYKGDIPYWFTDFDEDKPPRTWDETIVEVAKKLGYKNSERHGKYYANQPLNPETVTYLAGKLVDLSQLPTNYTKRYEYDISNCLKVNKSPFLFEISYTYKISPKQIRNYKHILALSNDRGFILLNT